MKHFNTFGERQKNAHLCTDDQYPDVASKDIWRNPTHNTNMNSLKIQQGNTHYICNFCVTQS